MPQGLSIHVGLNSVDPAHYAGWKGELTACELDAKDMETIASKNGFTPTLLLTEDATAEAVSTAISGAAAQLQSTDILFVSYSGHGGQVPDTNSDEDDRLDETWCLFDRQLVDDELYSLWAKFEPGTRIFVLSDSCHSGSAARETLELVGVERLSAIAGSGIDEAPRLKVMPGRVEREVYNAHRDLYDAIQAGTTAHDTSELPVHVLLISGCQDSQTSADGDRNGLFTQTLRQVWADGAFEGSYRSFWKRIVKAMPLWQAPNYFWATEPSLKFQRQRPFTI